MFNWLRLRSAPDEGRLDVNLAEQRHRIFGQWNDWIVLLSTGSVVGMGCLISHPLPQTTVLPGNEFQQQSR